MVETWLIVSILSCLCRCRGCAPVQSKSDIRIFHECIACKGIVSLWMCCVWAKRCAKCFTKFPLNFPCHYRSANSINSSIDFAPIATQKPEHSAWNHTLSALSDLVRNTGRILCCHWTIGVCRCGSCRYSRWRRIYFRQKWFEHRFGRYDTF